MTGVGSAIVLVTLAVKIVYDYRLYLKRIPVKHLKEWLILAAANVPAVVLFALDSRLAWYFGVPLSAAMIAFFIWLFFDGIYNRLRGFEFFSTGSDDRDDAFWDNVLQAIPRGLHIVIKVGGSALLITLYLIFLK